MSLLVGYLQALLIFKQEKAIKHFLLKIAFKGNKNLSEYNFIAKEKVD